MRILHTEASAGWGGQELRILSEMQALRSRGHALALAAPQEVPIHREAARLGLQVFDVPIGRKGLRGLAALRRLLARERFDVINAHSSTDTWLAALACASLRDAPPIVRTRHISAPVPRNPATRWLYDRACAMIVTTGERLRRELIEVNGFTRVPIVSVPTGIDPARFAPANAPEARALIGLPEAPTIGIVATLRSWKGHRLLVDALAQLPAPTRLLIVGDGPQREALESQVARAGLAPRVTFAGHDPQPERWVAAMDVFALPSTANEGVPQALMQAMMAGLACVTTDVGAIGEVARDGDTAIVVPADSVPALREALLRLLESAPLRRGLGTRARAFALAHCTLEAMADAMEAVFRRATTRGERAAR